MKNKISKTLSPWKENRLGLVQLDIAGPFPTSLRGNKYFMLIIDNATRRNWVICLPTKAAAVKELQIWKTKVEHQIDEKIKSVRSDNAPELLKAIREWTEKSGVQLEPTTIASSHQNGVAERNIQTAEADMRAKLKDADLPLEFWDEAVEADAYMRNRLQTGPIVDGRQASPEQAFTGKIPGIDHTCTSITDNIDVCFHYIRDLAEKGRLVVDYIPIAEMIADGLTKPLMRVNFQKFKSLLGLID
ncbi:hypothetical protein K3495_g6378 [Podosphaera aphanis]|nr:hypothetical protein K3495_g6378 [Podosphaera aphanis]